MTTLAHDFHFLIRIAKEHVILTRGATLGQVMRDAVHTVVDVESDAIWDGGSGRLDPVMARAEMIVAMAALEIAQIRHQDTRSALTSRRIAEAVRHGA